MEAILIPNIIGREDLIIRSPIAALLVPPLALFDGNSRFRALALELFGPVAHEVLVNFHFRDIVDLKRRGRNGGFGAGSFVVVVVAVSVDVVVGVSSTSLALATSILGDLTRLRRRHRFGSGSERVAEEDSHDVAVERRVVVFLQRSTCVFLREEDYVGRLKGIAVFVVMDVSAFEIAELLEQIVNVQVRHGRI